MMYLMMCMIESTKITVVVARPKSSPDIIKSTNGPKSSISAAKSAYSDTESVKSARFIRKNIFSNLLNFNVFSSTVHLLYFKYTPFCLKFKIKRPIKFLKVFFCDYFKYNWLLLNTVLTEYKRIQHVIVDFFCFI